VVKDINYLVQSGDVILIHSSQWAQLQRYFLQVDTTLAENVKVNPANLSLVVVTALDPLQFTMMNAAAAIEADIDRANNHRSSMLANA
jgi:hypothetical protein